MKYRKGIVVLLFCLLLACQPTPKQPFVVQKSSDALIEKAKSGETRLNDLPERYTAELVSKGGRLFVTVDAAIDAPNTALPVVRVRPCGIEQEQARRIGDVLFGENAHYVEDNFQRTRASLLRQAKRLEEDLLQWDKFSYRYDLEYPTKEDAERGVEELMHEAALAPVTLPAIEPPYEALPMRGTAEIPSTCIRVIAMPDEQTYSQLNVISDPKDGYVHLFYDRDDTIPVDLWVSNRDPVDETAVPSEAEARALCDDALLRMGLGDYRYACSFTHLLIDCNVPTRELMYTYAIGDAQMTYANHDTNDNANYAAPWEQSYVRFCVDADGILRFEWLSPFTYERTEVGQAALLPFSEISEIFERMVVVANDQIDHNEAFPELTQTLHITRVRLGLVSVREQNAATGLLVPAWDFLGYESSDLNGKTSIYSTNELTSYLTVNAIDGSIISRARGY